MESAINRLIDPQYHTRTGSHTGTETGSHTGTETGSHTGTETGSHTGTETGSHTGTETGSHTGTETGSHTTDTGSHTGTETGSHTATGHTGTGTGSHSDTETGSHSDTLVYPLIQMGLYNICQDQSVTTKIFSKVKLVEQLCLASGYFNLPPTYLRAIMRSKGVWSVLAASPEVSMDS